MKTKPTQHSVRGEKPRYPAEPHRCSDEMPISQDMKDKIALFCDIDRQAVIETGRKQSL